MKINSLDAIVNRLGISENGPVSKFMVETCYKHMDKYVPYDEGFLRSNVFLDDNSITYQSPYAHYQYVGKLYVDPVYEVGAFYSDDYGYWSRKNVAKKPTDIELTHHTPGTGPKWDERMKSAEMEQVIREIENFMRRK